MPCRSDFYCQECRTDHDYSCPVADARAKAAKENNRANNAPLPAPESLLCEACELLEDAGKLTKASAALQDWYKKHEACELDRLKFEIGKKLSTRERRVLGIDLTELAKKLKK